jgi:hypothetical protein
VLNFYATHYAGAVEMDDFGSVLKIADFRLSDYFETFYLL